MSCKNAGDPVDNSKSQSFHMPTCVFLRRKEGRHCVFLDRREGVWRIAKTKEEVQSEELWKFGACVWLCFAAKSGWKHAMVFPLVAFLWYCELALGCKLWSDAFPTRFSQPILQLQKLRGFLLLEDSCWNAGFRDFSFPLLLVWFLSC